MASPVLTRELITTARKGRAFALRSAYGLILLAVVAATYRGAADASGMLPATSVSPFARAAFVHLLLTQGLAVILLTPALVAGAVAGEVQAKTADELLTTDLSSAEIVLGKLVARLLHVVALVAAGFPVLLLAGTVGGIAPAPILLAEGATLTTAFFLGGLSILASTISRSVRGAMNLVFTLALSWLILPEALVVHLPRLGPNGVWLDDWVAPMNAWVAPATPFSLVLELARGLHRNPDALAGRVFQMAGLQTLYGLILSTLAVVALRPAFRARGGRRRRQADVSPTHPGRDRRVPCGDDPMIWKELFASPAPTVQRHLSLSVGVLLVGLLLWGTLDFALPALSELQTTGYGAFPAGSARALFLFYLRIMVTGVGMAFLLGIASDAASGMTTEREQDTWVSLITTPLTGSEIVRAKLLGAIWGIRHAAGVALVLAAVGVAAGSVHPLGLLLVTAELAAFGAFAAALGVWVSLRSTETLKAVAATFGGLFAITLGPTLLIAAIGSWRPLAVTTCPPLLLAASLASTADVIGLPVVTRFGFVSDAAVAGLWSSRGPEMPLACLASVALFSTAAYALTRSACAGFDARLDRPTLTGPNDPVPVREGRRPRPHWRKRGEAVEMSR